MRRFLTVRGGRFSNSPQEEEVENNLTRWKMELDVS